MGCVSRERKDLVSVRVLVVVLVVTRPKGGMENVLNALDTCSEVLISRVHGFVIEGASALACNMDVLAGSAPS